MLNWFKRGLIVCLLQMQWANAADEHPINSPNGGVPYLVVKKGAGPSTRELGVYKRDISGAWVKLFLGDVELSSHSGNPTYFLDTAWRSQREETLFIINGTLRLLSVKSDPNLQKTFTDLGVGRWSIRDPLDPSKTFIVPKINRFDDVAVHSDRKGTGGVEYIVVSVRVPKDYPIHGVTGLTFGFALDPQNVETADLRVVGKPILLSTKFFTSDGLKKFISENEITPGFISYEWLQRLSQPRSKDSNILVLWRKDLRARMEGKKGDFFLEDNEEIPLIDAKTGQGIIPGLPSVDASLASAKISVVYDPNLGRHRTVSFPPRTRNTDLSSETVEKAPIFLDAALVLDKEDGIQFNTLDINGERVDVVQTEDGRRFLIGTPNVGDAEVLDKIELKPLKPLEGTIKKFATYVDSTKRLLVTSWLDSKDVAVTCIHEIQAQHFPMRITREFILADRFYDHDQISWRLKDFDVEVEGVAQGRKSILGFDDVTDVKVGSEEEYIRIHQKILPHIDVIASLQKKSSGSVETQSFFPAAKEFIEMPGRVVYREFANPDGKSSGLGFRRTGFSYPRIKGKSDKGEKGDKDSTEKDSKEKIEMAFINGLWISSPGREETDQYIVDRQVNIEFEVKDKKIEKSFRFNALLVNTAPAVAGGGLVLFSITEPDTQNLPQVFTLPNPKMPFMGQKQGFDIVNLRHFAVLNVQPPSAKGDKFGTIFYSISIQNTGTYLGQIPFEFRDQKIQFAEMRETLLTPEIIPPEDVWPRLRRDYRDQVVFLLTPEREETDPEFTILRTDDSKRDKVGSRGKINLKPVLDTKTKSHESFDPSAWRVSEYATHNDEERAKRDKLKGGVEFDYDFFPHLKGLLNNLADPLQPARHVVLIVPPTLKRYATDYPLALWLRRKVDSRWSVGSDQFRLMALPSSKLEQTEVFENFASMRDAIKSGKRVALLGTVESVAAIGIPKVLSPSEFDKAHQFMDAEPKFPPFMVKDESIQQVGVEGLTQEASATAETFTAPHMLYYLATEGRPIPLNQFKPATIDRNISTVIVATKNEWGSLEVSGVEGKYALKDHFEVVELEPPTPEMREDFILNNVFGLAAIQSIGYEVDQTSFVRRGAVPPGNPFALAARYLVNRAEGLAVENQMDIFESFLKVMSRLGQELVHNWDVRTEKRIDRALLERVLAQVFPLPLSLDILPKEDPYKILSRKDFIQLWNQTAFRGQLGIKVRMQQILLSALLPSEGKNVPASFMLYGENGNGKTSLVDTLFVDVLKLKPWKIGGTPDENKNATYLRINLQEVVDPKMGSDIGARSTTSTSVSVEKVVEAMDQLLSSPQGWRAAIILDDLHRAPETVRAHFLSRFRSLQDHKTFSGKSRDGKIVEYPTRNLVLGVIFNLTDKQDLIKKFAKIEWSPTEDERILASLSGESFPLDRSSLARFGTRINYQGFTTDAKGPKLRDELVKITKSGLNSGSKLRFVSPEVVNSIIEKFPALNGRDFVSGSTRSLASLPLPMDHGISIVVPRALPGVEMVPFDPEGHGSLAGGGRGDQTVLGEEEGVKLEKFVHSQFQAIPITSHEWSGKVSLLYYLLDNFRNRSFKLLMSSVTDEPLIQTEPAFQRTMLLPLAQAVSRHLESFTEPPLKALLNLEYHTLGAKGAVDVSAIKQEILQIDTRRIRSKKVAPIFPKFTLEGGANPGLFDGAEIQFAINLTQGQVMLQTIQKLKDILDHFLNGLIYREEDAPVNQWLDKMTTSTMTPLDVNAIKQELAKTFFDFLHAMDSVHSTEILPLSRYDYSRLFAILFDQAIHRLNWAEMTYFAAEIFDRVTSDLAFAQNPKVQKVLFESGEKDDRGSLFVPLDSHSVRSFVENVPYMHDERESEILQHLNFEQSCAGWLKLLGGKK